MTASAGTSPKVHIGPTERGLSSRIRTAWYSLLSARKDHLEVFAHNGPAGERVMRNLHGFCYASQPTAQYDRNGNFDRSATDRMEGRREVWLMIVNACHASDEELLALAGGHQPRETQE